MPLNPEHFGTPEHCPSCPSIDPAVRMKYQRESPECTDPWHIDPQSDSPAAQLGRLQAEHAALQAGHPPVGDRDFAQVTESVMRKLNGRYAQHCKAAQNLVGGDALDHAQAGVEAQLAVANRVDALVTTVNALINCLDQRL